MIDINVFKRLESVWAKSAVLPGSSGVPLMDHTVNALEQIVGFVRLYRKEISEAKNVNLTRILFYAALLHDFGKVNPNFQLQLRNGDLWGLRHEVLSLGFLQYLSVPESERGYLAAAIALHHKDWRYLLDGGPLAPYWL